MNQKIRKNISDILSDLADYPEALKRHDTAKLKGMADTFRTRVGDLRIIFHVYKENRWIIVTSIDRRAKAYGHISGKTS